MREMLERTMKDIFAKYNTGKNKRAVKSAISILCAVSLVSKTIVPILQIEAIASSKVETSSNALYDTELSDDTPSKNHSGHSKKNHSKASGSNAIKKTSSNAEKTPTASNAMFKGILVCGNDEHEHNADCYCEDEAAAEVILMIHELPEAEEIATMMEEYYEIEETVEDYEEDETWKEYDEYLASLYDEVLYAYEKYDALSDEQKELVFNAGKLLELAKLFDNEVALLNIVSEDPEVQEAASTAEFITLNLYDYGSNINDKYYANNNMPGFQWNGGAQEINNSYSLNKVDCIDFGNSLITDFKWDNRQRIANKNSSNINGLVESPIGDYANYPIGFSNGTEVLSRTLKNGYPALADGTSLAYLFSDNEYAKKQNTESIDGLFQYDEETGAYWYKSRENHAQYSDNQFTLYKDKITPNFILYPFGNFLPFNDITNLNESTQVSQISDGYSYIQQMIDTAAVKRYQGNYDTYQQMINGLIYYRNNYFGEQPKSAANMVSDFFSNGGPAEKQFSLSDFSELYNIDFNTEKNFFFGMDMSMRFMQPKGGLTGDSGNDPMVFEFSGDDDVWVYVDGVLFLDLSGIHRHVGGKIDFVNGKVTYYGLDPSAGDTTPSGYRTYTFAELLTAAGRSTDGLNSKGTFKDYTYHDFNFYYMERGSGSSVCELNFNFPLLRQNTISVEKELTVNEEGKELLGNKEFNFQILKADDSKNKTSDLFITEGTEYALYGSDGKLLNDALQTDTNGIFQLKPGQRAEFSIPENGGNYYVRELLNPSEFEQYGKIAVNGTTTTTVNHVSIESKTFTGADSPVQNASDGAVRFTFNNQVDFEKIGSIEIEKILKAYHNADAVGTTEFEFSVTLNDELLPVGTKYMIGTTEKTVETEGIVAVPAGSKAVISGILIGTAFEVEETAESAKTYDVSYTLDGTEVSSVSGIITKSHTAKITVTNTEIGATVEIPVKKILVNGDGKEHSYTFDLVEMENLTTAKADGLKDSKTVTLDESGECTEESSFAIDYLGKDFNGTTKLYYMITEQEDSSLSGYVKYDTAKYVVEVTVTKGEKTLNAEITKWYVNGNESDISAVTFTNMLLGDICIMKTVEDTTPDETMEFSFTMHLAAPYNAINGTYGDLSFENGTAVFTLKHNETKAATGLPLGAEYTITEEVPDGYWAEIDEVPTNQAQGVITKDENIYKVHVINHKGIRLPETGGSGTLPYQVCGLLSMITAIGCFFCLKKKQWEV